MARGFGRCGRGSSAMLPLPGEGRSTPAGVLRVLKFPSRPLSAHSKGVATSVRNKLRRK